MEQGSWEHMLSILAREALITKHTRTSETFNYIRKGKEAYKLTPKGKALADLLEKEKIEAESSYSSSVHSTASLSTTNAPSASRHVVKMERIPRYTPIDIKMEKKASSIQRSEQEASSARHPTSKIVMGIVPNALASLQIVSIIKSSFT